MNHVRWPLPQPRSTLLSRNSSPTRWGYRDHTRARAAGPDLGVVGTYCSPWVGDLRGLYKLSLVARSAVASMSAFAPVKALWNEQQPLTRSSVQFITSRNRTSEPPASLLTEERKEKLEGRHTMPQRHQTRQRHELVQKSKDDCPRSRVVRHD